MTLYLLDDSMSVAGLFDRAGRHAEAVLDRSLIKIVIIESVSYRIVCPILRLAFSVELRLVTDRQRYSHIVYVEQQKSDL